MQFATVSERQSLLPQRPLFSSIVLALPAYYAAPSWVRKLIQCLDRYLGTFTALPIFERYSILLSAAQMICPKGNYEWISIGLDSR